MPNESLVWLAILDNRILPNSPYNSFYMHEPMKLQRRYTSFFFEYIQPVQTYSVSIQFHTQAKAAISNTTVTRVEIHENGISRDRFLEYIEKSFWISSNHGTLYWKYLQALNFQANFLNINILAYIPHWLSIAVTLMIIDNNARFLTLFISALQ